MVFRHALGSDPLFDWDALTRLALRRANIPRSVYHSNGHVTPQDSWAKGTRQGLSLSSTLATMKTGNSLIVLKGVEDDAEYAPMVRDLMAGIMKECGPEMTRDVVRSRATIFLASPHRVTTYHIDEDTNFLFQLHGSKDFHVYPHTEVLCPDTEMERYFAGDSSAIKFCEERRALGRHYRLDAQSAVHVPVLFPHWAKNGETVSIALSINFDLRSMEAPAQLYRMNYRLRHLGLSPLAPGRSARLDNAKLSICRIGKLLRRNKIGVCVDRLVSTASMRRDPEKHDI